MNNKKISTKTKIIICGLIVLLLLIGTGFTVWAIARKYYNYNAGFNVSVSGDRYVNATIKGASYLPNGTEAYETLEDVIFNSNTASEQVDLTFQNPITIQNNNQEAKLKFEIKNTSTYSNHGDLIINLDTTTHEINDMIINWFYSTNNTTFSPVVDKYLVAHKNESIYLELRLLATENFFGNISFEDNFSINLYSELAAPTDFTYTYTYGLENFWNEEYQEPTPEKAKIKTCPTCGKTLESTMLASDEFEEITASQQTFNEKITNKIFWISNNSSQLTFNGGMENVVIYGESTTSHTITLNITGDNSSSGLEEYKNISITNCARLIITASGYYDNIAPKCLIESLTLSGCGTTITFDDSISFEESSYSAVINNLNIFNTSSMQNINVSVNNLRLNNIEQLYDEDLSFSNINNLYINNGHFAYSMLEINQITESVTILNSLFYTDDSRYTIISNIDNAKIKLINNTMISEEDAPSLKIKNISNSTLEIYDQSLIYKLNENESITSELTFSNPLT